MPVELSVKGLAGMQAVMKTIEKLTNGSSGIRGIEFHGTMRDDGSGLTNAKVADYLKDGSTHTKKGAIKRDFFTASDDTKQKIAETFAKVADVELQKMADKMALVEAKFKKAGKSTAGSAVADRVAREIASTAFKNAAEEWRQVIVENLESGTLADGSAAEKVGKAYAKWRQEKFGISEDTVGQASGDLLTNMSDAKAFKFIKS